MLKYLQLHNVGPAAKLELEFAPWSNPITGERQDK